MISGMAQGSWLMLQGSRLEAQKNLALGAWRTQPQFFLALSHEPWGMSREPAMNH